MRLLALFALAAQGKAPILAAMIAASAFRLFTLLALGLALSLQGVIGCAPAAAAAPQDAAVHCAEMAGGGVAAAAPHDAGQPADDAGGHDCSKACHTAAVDPALPEVSPAPAQRPLLFGLRLSGLAGAVIAPAIPPPRLG